MSVTQSRSLVTSVATTLTSSTAFDPLRGGGTVELTKGEGSLQLKSEVADRVLVKAGEVTGASRRLQTDRVLDARSLALVSAPHRARTAPAHKHTGLRQAARSTSAASRCARSAKSTSTRPAGRRRRRG